ncbi:MAG: sulfonate ABC transporter substrate-binding protein, partial [Myxococcales bacterium]
MPAALPRRALLGAALAAPLVAGCRRDPAPPAVGYLNNLTHAQALVSAERWARSLGLRMVAFSAGPDVMEALSAGSLVAGFMGPSAALNAYARTRGRRGLVLRGAAAGGASLIVRDGLGITSPEHLRGRIVTASQIGSMPDVSMRSWLPTVGLAPRDRGGDVTVVPMPNAEALAMLKRGRLDAVWAQEPWASRMVAQARGVRLLDERSLWPDQRFPTSIMVTTRRVLDEQRPLLERLVASLDEETTRLRALPDGGRAEVGAALARATGKALPEPVLREAWSRLELTPD